MNLQQNGNVICPSDRGLYNAMPRETQNISVSWTSRYFGEAMHSSYCKLKFSAKLLCRGYMWH